MSRNDFRKTILGVFFFLLLSDIAFAQKFRAGLITGFTTSQVSGDQLGGFDKSGFEFGGLVAIPVSQKFDFSFQIVFIQKGSKKPFNAEQGDYSYYLLRLNYIEVPFLLQYNFSKNIQFEAGPTFGKLISSKEEDEHGQIPAPKEFRSFDLGAMFGMNYMLFTNFYICLEGSNSLFPIRDADIEGGRDQYNSVLMFSLKYVFNKKTGVQ
ncbi:MAG: outer membrane beta-barrel protein [Bacteroidia bacterium]